MELPKDFDKEITEIIHGFPVALNELLKNYLIQNKNLFSFNTFQIELVVDTNILYSEVRSLMLNESSFLMKLCKNPFIKIYAPSQIKIELYEKIRIKFPKDKKTRDLNHDECVCAAKKILAQVEINDTIDNYSKVRAENILNERDADDIPFLALTFSLKTHGIISKDKDIIEQSETKVWELKDAGRMITEINKGAFSFLILGNTIPLIWKTLYRLLLYLWRLIINSVKQLAMLLYNILKNGISYIAQLPTWLLIILGIAAFAISQSDNTIKNINDFFSQIWEKLKPILEQIKELFNSLIDIFKELYSALSPVLNLSVELLSYLTEQSMIAYQRLDELDKQNL